MNNISYVLQNKIHKLTKRGDQYTSRSNKRRFCKVIMINDIQSS